MTAVLDVIEMPTPKVYEKEYSLFNKEKGYIWLGNRKQRIWAIVKPHKKGLLYILCKGSKVGTKEGPMKDKKYTRYKKMIIPGNYSRYEVLKFLVKNSAIPSSKVLNHDPKKKASKKFIYRQFWAQVSHALAESGYWRARGKINWPDCPKEFWAWCPLF